MPNVIELQNIHKVFKIGDTNTVVLENVTLSIAEGEFVAIMGPSGSGKSTLMNIMGLLDTPSSGVYKIDGQDMKATRDKDLAKLRREKIGFVFQSFNLLPRLTVLQNVELPMIYGRKSKKERNQRAMHLLRMVGLEHRAKSRPTIISGGETQRTAVARALANNPSLILADEPTGNLDSKSSDAVMSALRDLHKKGVTIVVITHNPEIAEQAQRIITIRDGLVKEHPVKREVAKPETPLPKKRIVRL